MARVTCRCGETLKVTSGDPDRLVCPRCGAKIRVRRSPSQRPEANENTDDGYVRFNCPCGRRLKVRSEDRPEAGKCPDCGRIVPVPEPGWNETADTSSGSKAQGRSHPTARTEDMDTTDLERLERWANRFHVTSNPNQQPGAESTTSHQALNTVSPPAIAPNSSEPVVKMEAGLRVCHRCGKPLHMSATVCRSCGEPVPKR
jgi:ribosomal protein L40E